MKKSPEKLAAYLEKFNEWRRKCAYQRMPHPKKVGDAIDQAVQMLKTMNKTSKEQIIELHTGKTVEEIEKNNRIVKTLVSWQPMETAPKDREFLGVWGPKDLPPGEAFDVFYYEPINQKFAFSHGDAFLPTQTCTLFAWMEIPKYEG